MKWINWLVLFLFLPLVFVPSALAEEPIIQADTTVNEGAPSSSGTDSLTAEYEPAGVKFFTVDHAIFHYSGETDLLEVFALIDRSYLGVDSVDGGLQANYRITFKVYNDSGLVTGDTWTRADFSRSMDERIGGQKIPELMKYAVQPGKYRVEVTVTDLIAKVYRTSDIRVEAKPFPEYDLAIGDIIIASRVQPGGENAGEFNHNGLLVLPNADRIFGPQSSEMYFYTEVYNLEIADGGLFTMKREIYDTDGNKVMEHDPVTRPVKQPDIVDYAGFSVGILKNGSYTLKITAVDEITGGSVTGERRFWVYQPGQTGEMGEPVIVNPGFDISAMSDEEIDRELKVIRYLLNRKVIKAVEKLGPRGKRAFLAKFWVTHDPDHDTPENELRDIYLHRVAAADSRFGTLNREGWKTDMGRIYCLHGEPSDIEEHPFDIDAGKAYQIWQYDALEGGVYFVFVDRNGYGDYILVHSTKDGEPYNPRWHRSEVQGF